MSTTLPLLAEGCQVVRVKARDLSEIATLHHWHTFYDRTRQRREIDYGHAWIESRAGLFCVSVLDITTPEDWRSRHLAPVRSVAQAWKDGDAR